MSKRAIDWENEAEVIEALKENPANIQEVGAELKKRPEIASIVLKQNPWYFDSFPEVEVTEEMLLEILDKNLWYLYYIPYNFKNVDFYVKVANQHSDFFDQCPELRENDEILLKMIEQNPKNIEFAPNKMKNVDFYIKAVTSNPLAFKFIDQDFKDNYNIIYTACEKNLQVIQYVENKHAINYLCQKQLHTHYFADSISTDKENREFLLDYIVQYAKKNNINYISLALSRSPEQKNNFLLSMVSNNGLFLQYLNDEYRNDEKIVMAAIKQNYLSFEFASDMLKKNKKIILAAKIYQALNLLYTLLITPVIILTALIGFLASFIKNPIEVQAVKLIDKGYGTYSYKTVNFFVSSKVQNGELIGKLCQKIK